MKRRTKIVATLGPASESRKNIKALIEAGMNIARFNFSHGSQESYLKMSHHIRELEKESGNIVSIMQDLQGPKIRIGKLDKEVSVKKDQEIVFSNKSRNKGAIHIPYPLLPEILKKGDSLLIEDGLLQAKVIETSKTCLTVKMLNDGIIKEHKGVNIPDAIMPRQSKLTKKDKLDLEFGIKKLKVDAVAVSFVERPEDIIKVHKEILKHTKRKVMIIAKIERKEALNHLEEIIKVADGIMVARGDLGIESKTEAVPIVQKRILKLARREGKPVIIATQILQSMVNSPIATRAEISDAATAIFDLADAFMLSNETAVGKYPKQAVKTLARVAKEIEAAIFKERELYPIPIKESHERIEDEAIALNACYLADDTNAKALVIMTGEGYTAQTVIKHRPLTPFIVVTDNENLIRRLNFMWGSNDIVCIKKPLNSDEAKDILKKMKLIKAPGDVVTVKLSQEKRSLVVSKI